MKADKILYNGQVYTADARMPWAQAVAIRGQHVVFVGDDRQVSDMTGPQTQRIDLDGRLVLPGLCDAHIHLYDWTLYRQQVQLFECREKGEMLSRVREWMEGSSPGDWVVGRGWNETLWPTRELPTRNDIDEVTGRDRPALLWRCDMHCAVANSAALELAGITADTEDPDGGIIGRDEQGVPSGQLWELAINRVYDQIPKPEPSGFDKALAESISALHRMGITAIHDQRMKDQSEGPWVLDAYQRLRNKGRLQLRINCNVAAHDIPHLDYLGLRSGFGDDVLRLGHIKFFADGTMGSRTAWMLEPFADRDSTGVCVTPPAEMMQEMRQAVSRGFPVSVHAIGDRANRVVLDLLEEVGQSAAGVEGGVAPHRIEHVQTIHPKDIPRLADLGVTASMQPLHILDDMAMTQEALGERASRAYNLGSIASSGALLALGSDAPVADPNPFLGFYAALTRSLLSVDGSDAWNPAERLSIDQVVEGYSLGAAMAAGWERTIGSISPGKRADLIVLDRDIFRLAKDGESVAEVAGTQVVMTLFDGQVVHTA